MPGVSAGLCMVQGGAGFQGAGCQCRVVYGAGWGVDAGWSRVSGLCMMQGGAGFQGVGCQCRVVYGD